MKKEMIGVIILLLAVGCAPKPEQILIVVNQTLTALPSQTPYATYTQYPTFTVEPSNTPYPTYTLPATQTPNIVIVTPTFTASPVFTATNTLTPTETPDPLIKEHGPGLYLIGVDIAPGVWRNNGKSENCYWKVSTKTGQTIKNFFGQAGGTAYLPSNGFQIEFDPECGNWTYLGPP